MMTMVDAMLTSADTSYQVISPVLMKDENNPTQLNPTRLIEILIQAQPKLSEAQQQLKVAVTARSHLKMESLTANIRDLVLINVDPVIALMEDGLNFAGEFPRLMGATSDGPKHTCC